MNIVLLDHDPLWAEQFDTLRGDLLDALGDRALLIEHVGSTAVPGLCAKPILDLLLVVEDSVDESAYVGPVEECGYVLHHREPHWYEHRMFKLDEPAVNLHVLSAGCAEVERMIRFRDLLRSDDDARAAYEAKKRELARLEWSKVQDYADAKTDLVRQLLQSPRNVG